jgi:hypothetical protein
MRERQLEGRVLELTRSLREERIRNLVDLHRACGLIAERERSDEEKKIERLGDDAVELIRRDLVRILARINSPASSHGLAGASRQVPYIA